jgi:hypothetical protein
MPDRITTPLIVVFLALTAGQAWPTTVVPASDPGELARTSDAVFLARAGASTTLMRPSYIVTVTEMEVLRVVSGSAAPGSLLEVAAPGGFEDGRGWLVAGSPRFAEGEEYLVFAGLDGDGRWQPRLLADSVLRRETQRDGSKVLVPLDEARALKRLGPLGDSGLVPAPVDEDGFIEALLAAFDGSGPWSWDGLLAEAASTWGALKVAPAECAFMVYEERSIRWNVFDDGGSAEISAASNGDPDLEDGGAGLVSNAVDRWMSIPWTSLDLRYGGTRDYTMRCNDDNDQDTPRAGDDIIVFDDPCDDIDDLENCGGTLAFGGPWFGATHSFDGETWYTASSWFVVINNGVGRCLSKNSYELMIAHELGHGLGFGHTDDHHSLMYENCCNAINSLDERCARYLYPSDEAFASTVTVPVVALVDGVGGTPWRSDVVVANPTERHTVLDLAYQPGDEPPMEVTRSLPPLATVAYDDIVDSLFKAGDGRGPLRVTARDDNVAPVIVSRTYAVRASGNFGSGLAADVRPSASTFALPGLREDDDYRSNISVTAAAGSDVKATFELFRAEDGLVSSGVARTIEAGRQEQWNLRTLFPGSARDGVPMTVRVTLDQAGVVNASLVDNLSTDSAVFVGEGASDSWVVPAVVHAPGKDGTVWTSSVALWNASGAPATVQLEYLPQGGSNAAGGLLSSPIELEAFETLLLEDVALSLFGVDNGSGALAIEASGEVQVTSRVTTAAPAGGTSGNGVRAVHLGDWSNGRLVLPGARLVDGFRTNVGFVTGDAAVDFQCTLYNGNGAVAAEASIRVNPRSLRQRSLEQLFGGGFQPPDPVGTLVVEGDGDFLAYLTVIDGTSQDPIFVMPR